MVVTILAVAEVLLDHDAAVDAVQYDGCTALMIAAQEGHAAVANVLLAKGAMVDKVDRDGKTALVLARDNNHPHLVALLERAVAEA